VIAVDIAGSVIQERQIQFRYGKSMRSLGGVAWSRWRDALIFTVGKFAFIWRLEDTEFKILKLFSAEVAQLRVSASHLLVLTRKEFAVFSLKNDSGVIGLEPLAKEVGLGESTLTFDVLGEQLVFLTTSSEVILREVDRESLKVTARFKLTSQIRGDTELNFLGVFAGNILAVGNKSAVFVLSADLKSVKNCLRLASNTLLVAPSATTYFPERTKDRVGLRLCVLGCETYAKETKRSKFESKPLPQQLCLFRAYLTKKIFERKSCTNPVELLREIMGPIILKKALLKDPGMKQVILDFFETLKLFSVDRFSKKYILKPRVQSTTPASLSGPTSASPSREETESKRGSLSEAETADSLSSSPKVTGKI